MRRNPSSLTRKIVPCQDIFLHADDDVVVLGICGPACSGKNEVCKILAQKGFLIIDADALGQQALQVKVKDLIETFGRSVADENGQINRKKLGMIVFSSRAALKKLNAISHPYIVQEIQHIIRENPDRDIALNAALLPWVRIPEVDVLIWVTAGFFVRLFRSLKRDKRGLIFSLKRMWVQRNLSPKLFFKQVDTYTVRSNAGLPALEHRVTQILNLLSSQNEKAASG